MSKIFVDTNVLIYALYSIDSAKKKKARERLQELEESENGVISTQVLQEFYVACTRKLRIDPVLSKKIVQKLENFEVITVTPRLIQDAIDCSITNEISFWDSLILATARSAKCNTLWSEDLNSGQVILDVKILNPFQLP